MDNTYVYLSSNDSSKLYPHNTPTNFTVALPQTLQLKGKWSANLLDICANAPANTPTINLYAACSIVTTSFAKEQSLRILRQITLKKGKRGRQVFSSPQYVTVDNTSDISVINITILDTGTLLPATLSPEAVSCTLHIKRDSPPLLI